MVRIQALLLETIAGMLVVGMISVAGEAPARAAVSFTLAILAAEVAVANLSIVATAATVAPAIAIPPCT